MIVSFTSVTAWPEADAIHAARSSIVTTVCGCEFGAFAASGIPRGEANKSNNKQLSSRPSICSFFQIHAHICNHTHTNSISPSLFLPPWLEARLTQCE